MGRSKECPFVLVAAPGDGGSERFPFILISRAFGRMARENLPFYPFFGENPRSDASIEGSGANSERSVAVYEHSIAAYERSVAVYERSIAAYERSVAVYEGSVAAYEHSFATYEGSFIAYERSDAANERSMGASEVGARPVSGDFRPKIPFPVLCLTFNPLIDYASRTLHAS
jgi:hypothetical protein